MSDIVRVPPGELRTLCHDAFAAAGVPTEDAVAAGDILWLGEMMGITTHGVRRLIFYMTRVHDGAIQANPDIKVERTAPAMAIIDGGNGLGPVVGSRGVDLAVELAKQYGTGYVACRDSHHFGPVAPYAHRAVQAGMVCFMGTNAQPVMAPWRGAAPRHGNNPFAFAGPRRNGPPFILDMAQSVVAFSKLRHAHEAGVEIPPGWAADGRGRVTTDPKAGMDGWVLPIGEHKGYGLALAVEMLAAVMSGGAFGTEVKELYRRDGTPQGVCHFFMCFDPEKSVGRDGFLDRMDALCAMMSNTPPVDAGEPVLVPGEPEAAKIAENTEHGVPLPRDRLDEIKSMARGEVPTSMPPQ